MTDLAAPLRVIEETPAYWRIIFDYPPFNIADGTMFQALLNNDLPCQAGVPFELCRDILWTRPKSYAPPIFPSTTRPCEEPSARARAANLQREVEYRDAPLIHLSLSACLSPCP
jgi:hypothetical protein